MVKNEKYIKILNAMISCINHGDYYSVKELSIIELQKMRERDKKIAEIIKKEKIIRKNKEKPLNYWKNEELRKLIECYSEYILQKIENAKNIKELQQEAISVKEYIEKM